MDRWSKAGLGEIRDIKFASKSMQLKSVEGNGGGGKNSWRVVISRYGKEIDYAFERTSDDKTDKYHVNFVDVSVWKKIRKESSVFFIPFKNCQ